MAIILKNSTNTPVYEFPSGCNLVMEPWSKRQDTEPRAYQHGAVKISDEKVETRIISLHGIFNVSGVNATYGATLAANLKKMKQQCYTEDLRLYPGSQYTDEFYFVECLNFESTFLGTITVVEINIDFICSDPFRYYKDATTDTHYLSNCLSLTGAGYASIADGSQKGLDMGLSDIMEGIWIKTSSTVIFPIIYKGGVGGYYDLHLNATTGYLECKINDGTNTATITGDTKLNDAKWHLVRVSIDKSSATGGRLYADGAEDVSARTDVISVLDIDNDGTFYIGYDGSNYGTGKYDEPEIWNFGYGGLPADVADYDTWRYANPHAALSSYSSGDWNGYADADRTDRHDGAGNVTNLVVGEKYGYITATPHTLNYQGGTLEDDGVFTATHTTGTIADGDANDHVWRIGLVAHWKLADYTDETTNANTLTAGGTGNTFVLASLIDSTVNNAGDIEAFPVITFTVGTGASISKIAITNITDAGKSFEYTPTSDLVATNIVEVDCQNGTVELNTGAGLADDIAQWSGRFIRLLSGNNTITIIVTGTVGTNQCAFVFRKRWL